MTKQEAIQAMRDGKKVRHIYFTDDEWIKLTPTGLYEFKDGVVFPNLLFGEDRDEQWNEGWELVL